MRFPRLLPALLAFLLLSSSTAQAWNLGPDLDIGSRSAILAEVGTGLVFFEKDADRPNDPASVTKLLTLYVAFETLAAGLAHRDDVVTVSAKAAGTGGSSMHLMAGEQVTIDELLHGIAIESGNDACMALAEKLMGSEDNFVLDMNLKADELGMKNSFFMTPHGLTYADQSTTAADLLALARAYLERYPEAVELHKQKAYTHNGITGTNKNPLLGAFEGADGLKTGFTGPAGYNLVATAQRDGVRLIAVVLGAPTPAVRAADAALLLDTGFAMSASSYMVNMGTYDTWEAALSMRDRLRLLGHRAVLEETVVNRMPGLRLLVGPYPDTDSAQKAREVLQVDGFKPKYVVHRVRKGEDVRFSPVFAGQMQEEPAQAGQAAGGPVGDEQISDGRISDGQDVGGQNMAGQVSDRQEPASQDMKGQDMAGAGSAGQDGRTAQPMASEEITPDIPDQNVPDQDAPDQDAPDQDANNQDLLPQDAPGPLLEGSAQAPVSAIGSPQPVDPDTPASDTGGPGMGGPGMGEPNTDKPGVTEPGMVVSNTDEPDMDGPGMGGPGMGGPPQPDMADIPSNSNPAAQDQSGAAYYGIPELDAKLAGKKELGVSDGDQGDPGP